MTISLLKLHSFSTRVLIVGFSVSIQRSDSIPTNDLMVRIASTCKIIASGFLTASRFDSSPLAGYCRMFSLLAAMLVVFATFDCTELVQQRNKHLPKNLYNSASSFIQSKLDFTKMSLCTLLCKFSNEGEC
jgi:hypothetical protein